MYLQFSILWSPIFSFLNTLNLLWSSLPIVLPGPNPDPPRRDPGILSSQLRPFQGIILDYRDCLTAKLYPLLGWEGEAAHSHAWSLREAEGEAERDAWDKDLVIFWHVWDNFISISQALPWVCLCPLLQLYCFTSVLFPAFPPSFLLFYTEISLSVWKRQQD